MDSTIEPFFKTIKKCRLQGSVNWFPWPRGSKKEVIQAEGALENAWFIGTDDSSASDYNRLYKEKYKTDPVAGGSNAYDIVNIILQCSQASDLNFCLHTIKDFHGALGTYSATDKNDFSLKPLLKCINYGKITSVGY